MHALRQAAELAHHHDALLIPVLAWLPPDSRRLPWPELRQIWHDDAWQRLWDTLDAAFGGLPDGIATQPAVLCGSPARRRHLRQPSTERLTRPAPSVTSAGPRQPAGDTASTKTTTGRFLWAVLWAVQCPITCGDHPRPRQQWNQPRATGP